MEKLSFHAVAESNIAVTQAYLIISELSMKTTLVNGKFLKGWESKVGQRKNRFKNCQVK